MKLKLTPPHWIIVALVIALYALPKLAAMVPATASTIAVILNVAPLVLAALGIGSSSGWVRGVALPPPPAS